MTAPAIRALVIDDEPLARVNLRALLDTQDGWSLVGEAGSGYAAAEAIRRHQPDVVFLDIRMPGPDGLEVAKSLTTAEMAPLVVFATAFEEHALEAFEVEATDYLIKPFQAERFRQAIQRLERQVRLRRSGGMSSHSESDDSFSVAPLEEAGSTTLVDEGIAKQSTAVKSIAVRSVGRVRLVEVSEIQWIGAAGNYVRLYLGDTCALHRATLASLEKELDAESFLRIHRSTLVNRGEVAELRTSVAGRYQLVLKDGTELEISQRFKQRVFKALLPPR